MSNTNSRLASIDVYRGFVMLLMMAEVLQLASVAASKPDSSLWSLLAFHQSHVAWVGCSLHDLIQPSFSFLVGVAMPFSIISRQSKGQTDIQIWKHTIIRSLILIGLGIFLRSQYSNQTYFTFEDTLTQIGLGYSFLYLISKLKPIGQFISFVAILISYWVFFVAYPSPDPALIANGLSGLATKWNINTNAAWAFDTYFLNLFPRESPFKANEGGYVTLSFIPTLATMIIGLYAGQVLQNSDNSRAKIEHFLKTAAIMLILSITIHFLGICPIVKRIWTPSWVLFSGSLCLFLMAGFYFIIDIRKHVKWTKILTFLGANSIVAYVLADGFRPYLRKSIEIHLGTNFSTVFGVAYQTLVFGGLILLIEILILRWMYHKKIFIKI